MKKEKSVKKIGKHFNFLAKCDDIKHALFPEMPMTLLMYKKIYLNYDDLKSCVSKSLLQEFSDIFQSEIPSRLLSIKRIKHQINFVA